MIHNLKLDKRERRFLREAAEREQERRLCRVWKRRRVDQTLIDKTNGQLLKLP